MGGIGSIKKCKNYGNVTSENGKAFGIISTNSVTIDKCCNYGIVTAKNEASGISRKLF